MNNAALTARIEAVHAALRASREPTTLVLLQEQLGWRHLPVWEMEQLQAQGRAARVPNPPGQGFGVDGRYVAR